jgi:hypothetical protein
LVKALAALLILAALVAGGLFLATGAGAPAASPSGLAASLGPAAGSPWLAGGAGVAFVLGVLLAGRSGDRERPYALREVTLLLSAGASAAFVAALVVGAGRGWSAATLGVLALGGAVEAGVGVLLSVALAVSKERRKGLFVPGLLATVLLATLHLVVFVLGSG